MKNKLFQIVLLMGLAIAVISCTKDEVENCNKKVIELTLDFNGSYFIYLVRVDDNGDYSTIEVTEEVWEDLAVEELENGFACFPTLNE